MDPQRRTQSVDTPERKYQLISMASIKLFAESKGYVVNDDVIRMLSEDVNYRVRELVSVSNCLIVVVVALNGGSYYY